MQTEMSFNEKMEIFQTRYPLVFKGVKKEKIFI